MECLRKEAIVALERTAWDMKRYYDRKDQDEPGCRVPGDNKPVFIQVRTSSVRTVQSGRQSRRAYLPPITICQKDGWFLFPMTSPNSCLIIAVTVVRMRTLTLNVWTPTDPTIGSRKWRALYGIYKSFFLLRNLDTNIYITVNRLNTKECYRCSLNHQWACDISW